MPFAAATPFFAYAFDADYVYFLFASLSPLMLIDGAMRLHCLLIDEAADY